MVTVNVHSLLWPTAKFRSDGKVRFAPATKWFEFEAKRKDVLEQWPVQPLRVGNPIPLKDRSKGGRPSTYNEVAAILDQLSTANPSLIDKIKHRDFVHKSLADEIRKAAGKNASDGWADNTLRDHVKRWLASKRPPD